MKTTYRCLLAMALLAACSPKTKVTQSSTTPELPQYLLTVGNEDIPASEFLHMLSKNRQFDEKGEKLTEKEFEENFQLFIDYKLKVQEAEALEMDQSEEFDREFSAFKEDLKRPYTLETSLQQGEVRKAYGRMHEMLHAQHILLRFPPNSSKEDSLAVLRMALSLKEKIENGEAFGPLALEYSQDPSVTANEGDLGYFTALQMVPAFEEAAYQLKIGEVSSPVLSEYGYHIIQLLDKKTNPGQVKASHILVRLDPSDPASIDRARRKISDIYAALQKDKGSWNEVCKTYSEDTSTKDQGGQLPWFGVGDFVDEFENAAFALEVEGQISAPVQTSYGFHILKLDGKKPLPSFEEMEKSLQSKVLRANRSHIIQSQVTAIQKSRYSYSENTPIMNEVKKISRTEALKSAAFYQKLKDRHLLDSSLFSIMDSAYKVRQFVDFVKEDMVVVRESKSNDAWVDKYIEISLENTEEADLLANNEDYRLTIQEYRDGILLFNLMNENVWQKALLDTAGTMDYYRSNAAKYQWGDRVEALIVTVIDPSLSNPIMKFLQNKSYSPSLKDKLEDYLLDESPMSYKIETGVFEKDSIPALRNISISPKLQKTQAGQKAYILVLGKEIPAGPKVFEETRGKVIQDYQEYLNRSLLEKLKESYLIRVNEDEKERIKHIVVAEK
ncbi:peptidylprolyl isomerase [Echinicola pacifica]|nr:peptidylprolyl isomerase [Echinicola pacifica]